MWKRLLCFFPQSTRSGRKDLAAGAFSWAKPKANKRLNKNPIPPPRRQVLWDRTQRTGAKKIFFGGRPSAGRKFSEKECASWGILSFLASWRLGGKQSVLSFMCTRRGSMRNGGGT